MVIQVDRGTDPEGANSVKTEIAYIQPTFVGWHDEIAVLLRTEAAVHASDGRDADDSYGMLASVSYRECHVDHS